MEKITKVLSSIQCELHAPKNQRNKFGNYNYRSAEDILEGLKPLLKKHGAAVLISENIDQLEDKILFESNVKLLLGGEEIGTQGFAFVDLNKKGMSYEQATGAASSYAKKYALGNLFAIDDNKDPDSIENAPELEKKPFNRKQPKKIILDSKHGHWNEVLNALQTGKRTVDQIKEKFDISESIEKILLAHQK